MTRLVCLTLIATLASVFPIHAQNKNDAPKNVTNSIGMKFVWIPPGKLHGWAAPRKKNKGKITKFSTRSR